MNKHLNCRCEICDHINLWGGEYRDFPLPGYCIECYSEISSVLAEMLREEGLGYPTGDSLDARPEPTSGLLDPIYEETMVEKDTEEAPTLP